MHKKRKYNGHNVHKGHTIFPMVGKKWSATFMYVVCPEKSVVIGWYEAPPNPETEENNGLLGRLTEWRLDIRGRMLGKHGYLQEELRRLEKKCRERLDFQLCHPKVNNLKLFNDSLGSMTRDILYKVASLHAYYCSTKEEKKMGELCKDRLTLGASEGCYLEITPISNRIIFHFGTESRTITVPDDYEINWGVREPGTCDLRIVKKKPKLLNMKFTVKAGSICRRKYRNSYHNNGVLADDLNAVAFQVEYVGNPLHLVIKDGLIIACLSSNELLNYDVGISGSFKHAIYTADDIPLIESKIRVAYNNRKIFPNATNGIEIIREDL